MLGKGTDQTEKPQGDLKSKEKVGAREAILAQGPHWTTTASQGQDSAWTHACPGQSVPFLQSPVYTSPNSQAMGHPLTLLSPGPQAQLTVTLN